MAGSPCGSARRRAGLSQPADHADRAVPARRQHHHRRAHRRRQDERGARPVDRRRQPRRRRRHHRHPRGREKRARRLHHPAGIYRHARDRAEPLRQCRLRSAHGFRADRPHRHGAEHPGGASLVSGAFGRRADRLCQGQSGQGQLRLGRHRHGQPRLRGIFRHRRGHEDHPRPLQGNRTGDHRPPRRPYSDGVRADPGHARKRQERQAAHARGDQRGALDPAAGGADDRGGRACPASRRCCATAWSRRPARRAPIIDEAQQGAQRRARQRGRARAARDRRRRAAAVRRRRNTAPTSTARKRNGRRW